MPKTRIEEAVIPEAAAAPGTPPRASMAYCIAPAAATPPGTIRPKALEASWDVITGPQRSTRRARRCTHHIEA